ncbi:MAG TPA: hypothetical protein PLS55_06810 [Thermogutta sp.]|nr:hypothetical protein [Thermogutta sp.]
MRISKIGQNNQIPDIEQDTESVASDNLNVCRMLRETLPVWAVQ